MALAGAIQAHDADTVVDVQMHELRHRGALSAASVDLGLDLGDLGCDDAEALFERGHADAERVGSPGCVGTEDIAKSPVALAETGMPSSPVSRFRRLADFEMRRLFTLGLDREHLVRGQLQRTTQTPRASHGVASIIDRGNDLGNVACQHRGAALWPSPITNP